MERRTIPTLHVRAAFVAMGFLLLLPVIHVRHVINAVVSCPPSSCPDTLVVYSQFSPIGLAYAWMRGTLSYPKFAIVPSVTFLSIVAFFILAYTIAVFVIRREVQAK